MDRRLQRADLPDWRRVRRYAVPTDLIEECTTHRLAGDWRRACAAAGMDVHVDLAAVAAEFGPVGAERIEADLLGLAPDLLRWHLPRALGGHSTLAAHRTVLLSTVDGPLTAGPTALLAVHLPAHSHPGTSQRLRLEVVGRQTAERLVVGAGHVRGTDLPPQFWHVDHLSRLPATFGGSALRMPRFDPDGSPLPAQRQGRFLSADDLAGHTEHVLRLLGEQQAELAWLSAGLTLLPAAQGASSYLLTSASGLHDANLNLTHLLTEARRLHERYQRPQVAVALPLQHHWQHIWINLNLDRVDPTAELAAQRNELVGRPMMAVTAASPSPDLDLLWHGMLSLDELHPLLRSTLFPQARPASGSEISRPRAAKRAAGWEVVRVRCRGDWHRMRVADGRLRLLDHDPAEEQREEVIRSLGGTVAGCFAVRHSWLSGLGRLPKLLRFQRNDLLRHLEHGNTRTVLAALDAGFDPHVRDAEGGTLLHLLASVDHTVLLPRLLAAGLDVNARCRAGFTPLHAAVHRDGSTELVAALLAAGASINTTTQHGVTPLQTADTLRQRQIADTLLLEQRRQTHQLLLPGR